MTDQLEKTDEAMRGYRAKVKAIDPNGANMFTDDTPLECGIENPEVCESCQ